MNILVTNRGEGVTVKGKGLNGQTVVCIKLFDFFVVNKTYTYCYKSLYLFIE